MPVADDAGDYEKICDKVGSKDDSANSGNYVGLSIMLACFFS